MPFRDKAFKEKTPSRCSKPINYLRDIIDPQVNNQILQLNDYLIADDGASYVSDILHQNAHYRVFECESNRITSAGLITLTRSLSKQTNMEYINFRSNEVANDDNSGLEQLAECVKSLPKLQRLNQAKNNLDIDCIEIIIKILDYSQDLKILDLSWNNFEDDQVYKIIDKIDKDKLKNIKIDLTGNSVKQSLRDKLGLVDVAIEGFLATYPNTRDEELENRRDRGNAPFFPSVNDNNMFLDYKTNCLKENIDKTCGILPPILGSTNSRQAELELLLSEQRKRNYLQREHQKDILKGQTFKGRELDGELLRASSEKEENLKVSKNLDNEVSKAMFRYRNIKEDGFVQLMALEDNCKKFTDIRNEKVRALDTLIAKMESELQISKREVNINWESKIRKMEEGIQTFHFDIGQLQKDVALLADGITADKVKFENELNEKLNFFAVHEKAKHENVIRDIEGKMLTMSEVINQDERRNQQRLHEFELQEKGYMDVVMSQDKELIDKKEELNILRKAYETVDRLKQNLAIDEGHMKDLENKLNEELKQINVAIREKKVSQQDNINEVIDTGIKDEYIIDETRATNELKIKELEAKVRSSVLKKEEIRMKMDTMIQQVNYSVSNIIYDTFIQTEFLQGEVQNPNDHHHRDHHHHEDDTHRYA